ncbi:MAG: sugar phosphate nucleotidyltransferase, partial [Proteobacteria bacterium]|nr:sugar phosphate nucleotidyltransferase [Pseudomonadota bacterium]
MAHSSLPSGGELPDNVYAVILAGGSGTRFWPKSRQKSPKQLCALGGATQTMLEITLARLDGFIPPSRRLIVTHRDQASETRRIVASKCLNILAEPDARNTANALAIAALEIEQLSGRNDAILISLHADHVVQQVDAMKKAFRTAVLLAASGTLALIGIVPTYAETGYGYIERGTPLGTAKSFRVASFREKPDLETAEDFLRSKNFYWNAGLFAFPIDLFLRELQGRLPGTVNDLRQLLSTSKNKSFQSMDPLLFEAAYRKVPKISVDHAVLEVSQHVSVVEADIGWQDVGSWDALAQCFSTDSMGNFSEGDILAIDSKNCTFSSDGPIIAGLGLSDLVVVHAKGAILVCTKSRAQDVKLIVDRLKDAG